MLDLAVAYRIYPGVSKTPAAFSENKYKLSELCLRSFKRALGSMHVKVWVLLDGCPPAYEELFRSCFTAEELEIVALNGIGNLPTFNRQIEILATQTEADMVYFAEDDYFYFPDALVKMVEFARRNEDVDFVTPYDHPDAYETSERLESHRIKADVDRHWRGASSTCLTFLARRRSLVSAQKIFASYTSGNNDCSLWLSLTQKLELLNPRVHCSDINRVKLWLLAMRWGWRQVLFGRRYTLWSPLPTLATHMEAPCVAPLVDWQAHFWAAYDNQTGS